MQSVVLKQILRHWDSARGGNLMPSFEQLQLSSLPDPIRRIWVYRYEGGRFTGRLADDKISKDIGKNFHNLPLEEAHTAATYLWVHRVLTRTVTEPAIYRSSGTLYRQAGRLIAGERIALPLAGDGITGDGVLGVSYFREPDLEGPCELINENEAWLPLR
jgi:hypothetical protein